MVTRSSPTRHTGSLRRSRCHDVTRDTVTVTPPPRNAPVVKFWLGFRCKSESRHSHSFRKQGPVLCFGVDESTREDYSSGDDLFSRRVRLDSGALQSIIVSHSCNQMCYDYADTGNASSRFFSFIQAVLLKIP